MREERERERENKKENDIKRTKYEVYGKNAIARCNAFKGLVVTTHNLKNAVTVKHFSNTVHFILLIRVHCI